MASNGSRFISHFLLILCLAVAVAVNAQSDESALYPIHRRVRCTLKQFPACFLVGALCPLECHTNCFMDCALCKPVCNCYRRGAVCQDPRFIGGDGITFYFHGKKDRDFCLVTEADFHVNAHFIGKRNPGMTRDFTWVQSLGVLFEGHRLLVGARKTAKWDDASDRLELAFDDQPISLPPTEGAKWLSTVAPHVSVARTRDANGVSVEVAGKFTIDAVVVPITEKDSKVHGYNITDDDCFAHLDLGFKFYGLSDVVDGVLGQTYRRNYTSRVKMGVAMPVLGGEREFSSSHLFSADCVASRFGVLGHTALGDGEKYGAMGKHEGVQCKCNSGGASGRGVVCMR